MSYLPYSDKTELQATRILLKLLEKYNVKATMFITGKCFTEEWEDAQSICNHPLVEIGGHNYFCFRPSLPHKIWNDVFNNYNGPYWYQYYDIKKTCNVIYKKTGKKITSWRNHGLWHGPNTEKILSKLHFNICADLVSSAAIGPVKHKDGIYNFPINIMPDYDHVYHADRTEAWVKRFVTWGDDFGSESYYIDQWTEIVLRQIRQKLENTITVNMLIHPITMYLCDKFVNLERILELIGENHHCFYSELPLEPSPGASLRNT